MKTINLEHRRRLIKEELWSRDFTRDLNNHLTEFVVSPPNYDEYIGKDYKPLEPRFLRTISKMFSAMLINFCIDKVIDAVIEADAAINERTN